MPGEDVSPRRPKESAMPVSATEGLVALSTRDSLRMLASHEVGRVVYTDGALPAVTPVNYAFDDGHVLLRTAQGSRLAAKTPGTIVAFEVDEVDRTARRGWSVVITGPCRLVDDEVKLAHINTLHLDPWAPGERNVVLEIAATIVTGYRIAESDPPTGGVG
jgi:nitroimidazol reductase NimA-like FMN-containing flavoprotein (pyridoxamine 5'-phosphate oxidase superfamily)